MNRDRKFRRALVGACLLHIAILASVAHYRGRKTKQVALLDAPAQDAVEVALDRVRGPEQSSATGAPEESRVAVRSAGRLGSHRRTNGVTAPLQSTERESPLGGTVVSGKDSKEGAASTQRGSLTLHQLGLADDHALAFALSQAEPPGDRARADTDRLRQSMQQGKTDVDRELGLGVPAPLIQALQVAARDLAIPTNSKALFSANFDGSGSLLGFELLQTDHASPQWNQLEQRVLRALNGRKLAIAKNTRGVDFKLRLVARSALPSGADPGLGVDLFGVPVKKGQGKRSSKISLLDPTPRMLEFEIPGQDGHEKVKIPVPGLVFNVLSLGGDPSDIGAPARHMIRIEVVDEKVY